MYIDVSAKVLHNDESYSSLYTFLMFILKLVSLII